MKLISTSLILSLCCTLLFLTAFSQNPPNENVVTTKESATAVSKALSYQFPYNLSSPDQEFLMPKILEEISGLSFSYDYKSLIAVQDELGSLFYINKENGKIEKEKKFWKEGDYEGVEVTGPDEVWVVKSTATIYEVRKIEDEIPEIKKHKSDLNKDNDVEGLGYDRNNNMLLMACKGDAFEGSGKKGNRMICGFDLGTRTVRKEPIIQITLENIRAYLENTKTKDELEKFDDFFDDDEDELPFAPSGIAIHPITGNIYILSSKKDLILVLSPQSEVLFLDRMKKKIHPQAEGICFDKDGTLFISNEAKKDDPGKIYVFKSRG